MTQANQQETPADEANIDDLRALIRADMNKVNEHIQSQLYSDVSLIDQLGHYQETDRPLAAVGAPIWCRRVPESE